MQDCEAGVLIITATLARVESNCDMMRSPLRRSTHQMSTTVTYKPTPIVNTCFFQRMSSCWVEKCHLSVRRKSSHDPHPGIEFRYATRLIHFQTWPGVGGFILPTIFFRSLLGSSE